MGHFDFLSMYGPTFLVALLGSLTLTPIVRFLAIRVGLVDAPGERRMHDVPIPKGGGLAIYAGFWIALFFRFSSHPQLAAVWLASTAMLLVGLADDRWDLKWYVKLGGQLGAALLFVALGGRIDFVTHPLTGATVYIGWWGVPLTVFWLVGLANVVNLIDGLDGLAAGVATIACIPLFAVAFQMGRFEAALLTVALAGAACGFLPYNFNPARVIMGDTGAMFIGFLLGAISVEGAVKGPTALAFVVPVLALGLPILDTVFSIVRRLVQGRPIYQADSDHLHHRLLAMGLSHKQAVLTLYGVSALMGVGALAAIDVGALRGLALFGLVAAGGVLFTLRVGGLRGASVRNTHVSK